MTLTLTLTPTPNQVVDASRLARLLYLSECGSAQAANAAMLRAPHGTLTLTLTLALALALTLCGEVQPDEA